MIGLTTEQQPRGAAVTIITVRNRFGQTSTVPACPSCVEEIANYHHESLVEIGGPSAATECESCRQGWVD